MRKEGFKNLTLTGHIDDKRSRGTAGPQPDTHVQMAGGTGWGSEV